MSITIVRNLLCWAIAVLTPVSVFADGLGAAMVHPYGMVWLNGAVLDHASAIFPGDLVQTNSGAVLKIQAADSAVTLLSDSLLRFDAGSVAVEHGGAKLATSDRMSAHAGIVTVTPSSGTPTEFQLTHAAGTVQVIALKGDLQISNGSETVALTQGQQATQTEADQDQRKDQNKELNKANSSTPAPAVKNKKKKRILVIAATSTAGAGLVSWGIYEAVSGPARVISPDGP